MNEDSAFGDLSGWRPDLFQPLTPGESIQRVSSASHWLSYAIGDALMVAWARSGFDIDEEFALDGRMLTLRRLAKGDV